MNFTKRLFDFPASERLAWTGASKSLASLPIRVSILNSMDEGMVCELAGKT